MTFVDGVKIAESPQRCRRTWFITARNDQPSAATGTCSERAYFCSRWTSLVELSYGPAAQSRHHL